MRNADAAVVIVRHGLRAREVSERDLWNVVLRVEAWAASRQHRNVEEEPIEQARGRFSVAMELTVGDEMRTTGKRSRFRSPRPVRMLELTQTCARTGRWLPR